MKSLRHALRMEWSGNDGEGTRRYTGYRRDHTITAPGRPVLAGSSDPAFRGDPSRYSPEELLLGALSACHMLWYLHLCAERGVCVEAYVDNATGEMALNGDGSGQFVHASLQPSVRISAGNPELARTLHAEAHRKCFIARSVNFPLAIEPQVTVA